MSVRDIYLNLLLHEAYYVAKGVRPMAKWEFTFRGRKQFDFWTEQVQWIVNQWSPRFFASYEVDACTLITHRTDSHTNRKYSIFNVVLFKKGLEKEAKWLIETMTSPHSAEDTKKIGLALGYAPELVDEFTQGPKDGC